jgi:hypothetical protein
VGELLDLVAAATILPIPELQSPEHEDEDEAHQDEANDGWDVNLWRERKPQRPTTEAASSRKLPMDVESDGDRVVTRTRALRKKLVQIVALDARVVEGHVLDRAQLQKVECKAEVEEELATLRPLLVTWGLSRAAKEPMVAGESAAVPLAAEEKELNGSKQGGDEVSNGESMRYDARLFRSVVALKGVTTTAPTTASTTATTTNTTTTSITSTTTASSTTATASPWGGRTAVESLASPLVDTNLAMGMSPSRNPKLRMGPAPRRAKSSTNLKKYGGKDKDLGKENDADKEALKTPKSSKPAWGTSSATPAFSLLSIQRMESPPIVVAQTRRERVSRITANPLAKADEERIFSLADFIPETPRCVTNER